MKETEGRYSQQDLLEIRKMIGANVARLRKLHHPSLTQFDLAATSGLRPEAISRIERGAVDFGISKLLKIARALGHPPAELLHHDALNTNKPDYIEKNIQDEQIVHFHSDENGYPNQD